MQLQDRNTVGPAVVPDCLIANIHQTDRCTQKEYAFKILSADRLRLLAKASVSVVQAVRAITTTRDQSSTSESSALWSEVKLETGCSRDVGFTTKRRHSDVCLVRSELRPSLLRDQPMRLRTKTMRSCPVLSKELDSRSHPQLAQTQSPWLSARRSQVQLSIRTV